MSDALPGCFSGLKAIFRSKATENKQVLQAPCNFTTNDYQSKSKEEEVRYHARVPCVCDEGLDAPPAYAHGAGELAVYKPEVLETIKLTVDTYDAELRELSLKIHDHPETAFQEKYAHDTLTAFMTSHGFTVTQHYADLETAWRAEFTHGHGGRVLGVNSEMDALPGIGHACGHNLIAVAGVGVALAAKSAMEKHDIPGKVVLLGTPAEEGGGGKVILIENGAYKDMDLCVMSHPSQGIANSTNIGTSLALQAVDVQFYGHTAHAAAAPWEGQNALDAAFLAYSAVSVLRQQIKPTHRVHGIVEGKNWAPNIIPDYSKMRWFVRAPTWAEVEALRKRVIACFEAAALATQCRYEVSVERPHYELVENPFLGEAYTTAAKDVGMEVIPRGIGGSTDFGNVTYELPSLHPHYAIPTEPNGGNHTPAFAASARTKEAHAATMSVVKALALTGVRALDDDMFFKQVKKSFEKGQKLKSAGL